MEKRPRILLLAGSAEARQIGQALAARDHKVHALMSERPRGANPMPVPFEVCHEVTKPHLLEVMRGADIVIDASHGFDGIMTQVGHEAAQQSGLPFISLARPAWDIDENAKWQSAVSVQAAMALVGNSERVFSATGWASLPAYRDFPGACLMLRQTSKHQRPAPYGFVELVFGDPPFTMASEIALFRDLRVDTLIARNLGGLPSRPKLDAAKELGLKVILIDRPALQHGIHVVQDVRDVLDWVEAL